MNLLSWLLFGLVLAIISITSSGKQNKFFIIAVGVNAIFFGVVLAHTLLSKGILGLNLVPFFIAVASILAFSSLQRLLREV